MEKIGWLWILISVYGMSIPIPERLQQNCLHCHQAQQIPSELIYRRYLLDYSTPQRIKKLMFNYLKSPSKANSIMPQQFFLKFPLKKATTLEDGELNKSIELYLDYFDVKKRLFLPQDPAR